MKQYTPFEYLQINLANHYGLDKEQFEDRIAWVKENNAVLEHRTLTANDAFRYRAALLAYRDVQTGKPIGYLVGLDAAASGIAILGALTGCKTTAANTGITGTRRRDIYGKCTKVMSDLLGADVEVDRDPVKKALMTSYYGSKAKPKEVFGEDTPELQAFYEAAETVAPGANALKEILLMAWQPYADLHEWIMPDGFHVRLPVLQTMESRLEVDELDHTTIKMLYEDNIGTERGLSLVANVTHSCDSLMVREVGRRCKYDQEQLLAAAELLEYRLTRSNIPGQETFHIERLWRQTGFLSLVGIEHVMGATCTSWFNEDYCEALLGLIKTTLAKPSFDILFIHDEYLCHPNYMNHVRQTVIDVLAEMADSNLASDILSQITGSPVNVSRLSTDLGDEIRKSEYIIN